MIVTKSIMGCFQGCLPRTTLFTALHLICQIPIFVMRNAGLVALFKSWHCWPHLIGFNSDTVQQQRSVPCPDVTPTEFKVTKVFIVESWWHSWPYLIGLISDVYMSRGLSYYRHTFTVFTFPKTYALLICISDFKYSIPEYWAGPEVSLMSLLLLDCLWITSFRCSIHP